MEIHSMDKRHLPDGPWQDEPDIATWEDPLTGLPCAFWRNDFGALCGYVGVDATHPFYEKDQWYCPQDTPCDFWQENAYCRHMPDYRLRPHGGVTFSGWLDGSMLIRDHWWFGFDCAHYKDIVPELIKASGMDIMPGYAQHYRDMDYVIGECQQLAWQLHMEAVQRTISP